MRAIALFLLLIPTLASARPIKVFLNGTEITGSGSVKFEKVDVKIDSIGDVHIAAPGYRVETIPQPEGQTSPPPASESRARGAPRKNPGRSKRY